MNEYPGREREQPQPDPDEIGSEHDDLLIDDELDEPLEEDIPVFLSDEDADELAVTSFQEAEEEYELPLAPGDEESAAPVEPPAFLSRRASPDATAGAAPAPERPRPRSVPAFEPATQEQARSTVFTTFRPGSSNGSLIGVIVVAFCFAVGLALLYKGFAHAPGISQFFPLVLGPSLLALGALFAYWTWGSLTLRYVVDRNALTIHWGAQRQVIPLANIERLIPASPEGEAPDVQGVDWPGHHIGKARVSQLGEVLFYSGHRSIGEVLYVQTDTETYAISVPDAVAFAEAVQSNQMRGSLFAQRQAVLRHGIAAQSFWLDPQARFLAVVLIASFVAVLAYVLQTYPGLAQSVPLRFPALGGLLRVTDKSELLDIPRSAAAFLGLNLLLAVVLHPWERMVSIVLLLAGIAIQIALLVAAIVAVA